MATQNKFAVKNGLDANNQTIQNIGAIDLTQSHLFDRGVQGRMSWNNDDETVDIGMAHGVIQQVGMEQYYHAKNQTGSTIPNGTVVRAAGTLGASGRILVTPAIADASYHAMMNMGVATHDIITGEDGLITNFGLVRQLDTTGTSVSETWADGDVLYLHPNQLGKLTKNRPVAPNQVVIVAIVIHAAANGSLFVRVTQSGDLGDLHNVYTNGGAENGDVLTWVAANNRWEPQGIASALGRSTTQFIATAGQTVFNTTYNAGSINVFHNGVLLSVDDYTATNGTSITLANAASADDVIVVEKFEATSDVQLAVTSVAGRTGDVTLTKSDVGLNNVDNTSDITKNVSSASTLTTARTLTIGSTGKSFNGSGDVSWSLAEIGAQAAGSYANATHTHAATDVAPRPVYTVNDSGGYMYGGANAGGLNAINVWAYSSAIHKYMPPSPALGSVCIIVIANGRTDNAAYVAPPGNEPIMGLNETMTIDRANVTLTFTYVGGSIGWRVS